jgi:glutathione S-transferase
VAVKLYTIPGSHPVVAVRRMLKLKGVDYDRVDLLPVLSHGILRVLRFPGPTVPALKLDDGTKISGSREIARELDRRYPEPPLLPSDPAERERVLAAEEWGDVELQTVVRRLLWPALEVEPGAMISFAKGASLGVPDALAARTAGIVIAAEKRMHGIDAAQARADIAALPGLLDHVDELIADGTLGDPETVADSPNAADLQIASSVRLALCLDELHDELMARPAGRHAMALFPHYPGKVPAGGLAKYR